MGVQIPRKHGQSPSAAGTITRVGKAVLGTDAAKKTARLSIYTRESTMQAQSNAPKTVTKTKELTLNMAKVHTPISGTKNGLKHNFN